MTEESQKEKLRQHFARRVTTQARVVLDTWQKIHSDHTLAADHREELATAADKLVRYAQRFEMASHADAGQQVLTLMADWPAGEAPGEPLWPRLQEAMDQLGRCTLRRTDHQNRPTLGNALYWDIYYATP